MLKKLLLVSVLLMGVVIAQEASAEGSGEVSAEASVEAETPSKEAEKPYSKVTFKYDLSGVDPACTAPKDGTENSCGIHFHAGKSCADAKDVGGHYYNKNTLSEDPWTFKAVYKADDKGVAKGEITVEYGEFEPFGRAFVLHNQTGARISCDLVPEATDMVSKLEKFSAYPGYTGDLKPAGSVAMTFDMKKGDDEDGPKLTKVIKAPAALKWAMFSKIPEAQKKQVADKLKQMVADKAGVSVDDIVVEPAKKTADGGVEFPLAVKAKTPEALKGVEEKLKDMSGMDFKDLLKAAAPKLGYGSKDEGSGASLSISLSLPLVATLAVAAFAGHL